MGICKSSAMETDELLNGKSSAMETDELLKRIEWFIIKHQQNDGTTGNAAISEVSCGLPEANRINKEADIQSKRLERILRSNRCHNDIAGLSSKEYLHMLQYIDAMQSKGLIDKDTAHRARKTLMSRNKKLEENLQLI